MPLVTEQGFQPLSEQSFVDSQQLLLEFEHTGSVHSAPVHVDLSQDCDPRDLLPHFESIQLIRIPFEHSEDGRGFSVARTLRSLGFGGRLRARGELLSDQLQHALAAGFNEIHISDELASRQPEAHWQQPIRSDYRQKLFAQGSEAGGALTLPDGVFETRVLDVQHYTDSLFAFRLTRPDSFRFRSGEFAMIGLPDANAPLFRAYSITTPTWEESLGFYSIKVPNGPLTRRLQHIGSGDTIWLRKKATGSLVCDAVTPGRRLFMLSTGTGIAPFLSLIRDPELFERFDTLVLTHTCRSRDELEYGTQQVSNCHSCPLMGELARERLLYFPSTTREASRHVGRITQFIEQGSLFDELGIERPDLQHDRFMICGSASVLASLRKTLTDLGFAEGSLRKPGQISWERSFVG